MPLTIEQRIERLTVWLDELRFWIPQAFLNLDAWTCNDIPLTLGSPWPVRTGVIHLRHSRVDLPPDWNPADTRLDLAPGGEGLALVEYSANDIEAFGVDPYHRRLPLRGRSFAIEIDAVARLPFGIPNRDPRLEVARVVLVDRAVEQLVRLLELIVESVLALGNDEVVMPLIEAGEGAFASLNWPSATGEYLSRTVDSVLMQSIWRLPEDLNSHPKGLSDDERRSVLDALSNLHERLHEIRATYPPQGHIRLSGHAHIDLAWLWPMEETRRKARRTFSTVTSLLDRYPELYVNQSSAQLYAFLQEDDPELFRHVAEHVRQGRWEPVGGMWVEPDMVMPAGESVVRQLLYGQRYFEHTFGHRHTVAWLPDCFGFGPALPQLFRSAGIEHFFTIKLNWSESNRFPYDLFLWEGLDGTRIVAHMFDNPDDQTTKTGGYNANVSPFAALNTWRHFRGKYRYPETLLSVGYGDGGGGVTTEMVERARDLHDFPSLPAMQFGRIDEFFERMDSHISNLPVWNGELYLELHRGTLTSQGRIKRLHRKAERDLVAAEVVSAAAGLAGGQNPTSLESLWRVLLRNEFHDILPGSSIREVYELAEGELGAVIDGAGSTARAALEDLARHIVNPGNERGLLLFNPDLSSRPVKLESASPLPGAQHVEGGFAITAETAVPAIGGSVLLEAATSRPAQAQQQVLENDRLRLEFASDGTLERVFDKQMDRDVLAGRGNQIWAYVDKPRKWDAWDIEEGYERAGEQITDLETMEIAEEGPHRAAIRLVRRFRNSRITQDIRIWANSNRVDFHTTLDWHDRHWLVKARFPLAVRAPYATFETAFGVVQRPTHRNTTWEQARFEVAAHRFVDLSEPGYGVAILNNGKYGHDVHGNQIGVSLLRAPAYPDPLADEGTQTFTYSLLPHIGDWTSSDVLMEAEDLNRPLLALDVETGGPSQWQALTVHGTALGLGTLKASEDGQGLVLRAYEPRGARGEVTIELPRGWEIAAETNILEDEIASTSLFFHPFQVRTLLLRGKEETGTQRA